MSSESDTDHSVWDEVLSGFGHGAECRACPVCMGLRALGSVKPEVVGHLTEATQHLGLALRALVEAATEDLGDATGESGGAHEPRRTIDRDDG